MKLSAGEWFKILIKILGSLLISAIGLYFATKHVEWHKMKDLILSARFTPIFIGMAASSVTYLLRAYRWQILLEPIQTIPLMNLLRWQVGGLFITNVFPLRLGEFVRAYWTGHKTSTPKGAVMATIVIERVLDVSSLAFIAFFIFSVYYNISGGDQGWGGSRLVSLLKIQNVVLLPIWGGSRLLSLLGIQNIVLQMMIMLAIFTGILLLWNLRKRIIGWVFMKIPLLGTFAEGLKIMKDKKVFAKTAILSVLIWSVDISILAIVSRSLDLNLSWLKAGMTMVGLILGLMVPAAPGSLGTYEAGGVAALTHFGFDKTLSLSFISLVHFFQYLFVITIGIPVLMLEGFSLDKILIDVGLEKEKP